MGFRNTPAYVQRQVDIILEDLKFAEACIDDIVIASRTFQETWELFCDADLTLSVSLRQ
jgi:hypothetical protein